MTTETIPTTPLPTEPAPPPRYQITRRLAGFDTGHRLIGRPPVDPVVRFWVKVVRSASGCWGWSGCTRDGYGSLWVHGRSIIASRFSYELHVGVIPRGLLVLHSCDNPPCCNPAHLFLGTSAVNVHDMAAKGRQARGASHGSRTKPASVARGERHGCARFTAVQVRAMRALYKDGFTQAEIAAAFGTSQTHVSDIVNRKVWALVEAV